MLSARNITVRYGKTTIVEDISLDVVPGEVLVVLGPNGAGKSTMLGVLSGVTKPVIGDVALGGRPVSGMAPQDVARQRAVLPQHSELAFGFRVFELVMMGRTPTAYPGSRDRDEMIAEACMAETEVGHLADRIYSDLSGGEKQRVHMARVLAQIDFPVEQPAGTPRYLLLDEPTSSLDLPHQHTTLAMARRAAERGIGVMAILHDLNLAAMYADQVAVLADGRLKARGTPEEVLTADTVEDVFHLPVTISQHPTRGCPHVIAV